MPNGLGARLHRRPAGPVLAQTDYSAKGLRVIVSFPPGGASDTLGRMVAQHLASAWSQPAIVENSTGAGVDFPSICHF